MNKQKLLSYIRLINTPGIGPIGFKKLMARYGDADTALSELAKKREVCSLSQAEAELMTAEIKHVKLITMEDKEYPYNLKQIEDYPPILYALGNIDLLKNDNAVAMVGSRNASISACRLAEKLATDLSLKNIVVVSGLARGIDAAAHSGALSANGNTIAVLGTGIDVVYPKENQKLYEDMAKNGLIISEFPFRTKAQASHFPRRNRIVSGLSKGTLVIEASLRSGSLITAHQALDQGRDVYAVPGAPYDDRCAGCNKLLREGALLVENAEDVINNFTFTPMKFTARQSKNLETADLFEYSLDNQENNSDISEQDNYSVLLSLLSEKGESIDAVIRHMELPAEQVLTMIVELELDNKIIRLPGNKIAKA